MPEPTRLLVRFLDEDAGAALLAWTPPDVVDDLAATAGERELLGELALPSVLRRRAGTVGPRSRAEVLDGLDAPLRARGTDLDRALGKDPSTRSRRLRQLRERIAAVGLDAELVLPPPAGGDVVLRDCDVDVAVLARAATDDGDLARAVAAVLAAVPDAAAAPEALWEVEVPAAVTEPEARLLIAEGIAAVASHLAERLAVDGEGEGEAEAERPPGRRRLAPALAPVALVVLLALVAVLAVALADDEPAGRLASASASGAPVTLLVDNRVTEGAGMREDPAPARLTSRPVPYCAVLACDIAGTKRRSGQAFASAVCQTNGSYVTNGDDSSSRRSSLDDDNPLLVRTTRYYGVRLRDRTFGYVSEAWIAPRQRGGLGLPRCPG